MTLEQLLIYAAVAAGGWFLRHNGIFAPATPATPTTPAAIDPAHPLLSGVQGVVRKELAVFLANLIQGVSEVPKDATGNSPGGNK